MFKVVIPCYNAGPWIYKCLQSVIQQNNSDWELVVINDGSTDNTAEEIAACDDPRVHLIQHAHNYSGPLGSLIEGTELLAPNTKPDDVIINIDGDDYLENADVLDYLQGVYADPNVWLTYGQYLPVSRCYSNHCQPVRDTRAYRKTGGWVTSHLRTYRKHLYDRIKREDLLDEHGKPWPSAGDLALMYPMVEMAGARRIRFIEKILYIYNDQNPIGDQAIRLQLQLACDRAIRAKPVYEEIP